MLVSVFIFRFEILISVFKEGNSKLSNYLFLKNEKNEDGAWMSGKLKMGNKNKIPKLATMNREEEEGEEEEGEEMEEKMMEEEEEEEEEEERKDEEQ